MARGNPREGRGRGRVSGCLTKGPVKMPCTMRMRWGDAGVEAAEHEVWRSTPSRSAAAAGGRRWAVRSGRRWLGRKVGEGARRGKGGVVMHLIGPWGTSCCLCLVGSEGGGGWRRDMKSSDVSSCPQMRAFAKGDRPRFPRPRGDLGGGPWARPVHSSAPGWRGRRGHCFFFTAFHTISLWPWLRSSRLPRAGSKVTGSVACIYEATMGWWFRLEASSDGGGSRGNPGTQEVLRRCTPRR